MSFGDSLVKHGIVPEVIERRTGRSSYNLAAFGAQAPTCYFLLRRALDAGARPTAILVDGELFEEDPRKHERLWSDLATFAEAAEMASLERDARFFAAVALGRIVPSIKARHEVRADVLAALRGELPPLTWDLSANWRNWRRNAGASLVAKPPPPRAEVVRLLEASHYLPPTWTCHPLNEVYVRKFLKLAATRNVPVYWLWPPVHPEVQVRRERGGRDAVFGRFLAKLQADFPDLTVIDARRADYPESAVQDLTHLNRDGALAFTAQVADVLRSRREGQTGPRWVDLPPGRTTPPDILVEDLDQSRLAVRELSATTRR